MTQEIVLNDLSALAQVRDQFPVEECLSPGEIDALDAAAQHTLDDLQVLIEADRARRAAAQQDLERWRRFNAEAVRVEAIAERMRDAADQAAQLAAAAGDPAERARTEALAEATQQLAVDAGKNAAALRYRADDLAQREVIRRLVAEEQRKEQEEKFRPDLALAESYLDAGRYDEARRLLSSLEGIFSNVPDLYETFQTLQMRLQAVKVEEAQAVIPKARWLITREPVTAIDLLEPLDLDLLPEDLVRQVHGIWVKACAGVGLLAAVYLRCGAGRGAVLIPAADGHWEVVFSLGATQWPRGRRVVAEALRRVQPLR